MFGSPTVNVNDVLLVVRYPVREVKLPVTSITYIPMYTNEVEKTVNYLLAAVNVRKLGRVLDPLIFTLYETPVVLQLSLKVVKKISIRASLMIYH